MPLPDALIIGAGVIGCATARELASRGLSVEVLDSGPVGAGASSAAAGLLTPHPAGEAGPAAAAGAELCRRSLSMYPDLATALSAETGIDVELGPAGILELALDEQEEQAVRRRLERRREAGFPGEWLDAAEARGLEPGLGPAARAGALYRDDQPIDNRRLMAALAVAARRAGARLEAVRPPAGLWFDRGRLRGVHSGSERREGGTVIVAAGVGAAALVPPGRPPLPVTPVRGQIAVLDSAGQGPRHPLISEGGYVVPRRDGRVLAGTTQEPGEVDLRPTAAGLARILACAVGLVPSLADRPLLDAWAGLRPATPDGWPLLGRDEEHPSLVYACGHGGNGVLLAPITARWIGRVIAGEAAPLPEGPFRPGRFSRRTATGPDAVA